VKKSSFFIKRIYHRMSEKSKAKKIIPFGIMHMTEEAGGQRAALSAPRSAAQFTKNSVRSARAGTPQRGVPTTIIRHVHNPKFHG
jgi:hypothetical protein